MVSHIIVNIYFNIIWIEFMNIWYIYLSFFLVRGQDVYFVNVKYIHLHKKKLKKMFTCLIGIKLIDGLIAFSKSKWRELWTSFVIIEEWELEGTFELESADCGDGGDPLLLLLLRGRTIAWMSNPDEVVAVTEVGCILEWWSLLLVPFDLWLWLWWLLLLFVVNRNGPLLSLLSAIEISTWGVRKCICE